MGKSLVIVESPAKSRTLKKYLGKDYEVLASYGHVRDLVPKEGAVDPEDDFAMRYEVIERNQKHVDAIARAARKADALYLATDPDREGEAISWHLFRILEELGVLKDKPVHRVVFHEITKRAIDEAMSNPRPLAQELVDAQQARRALDYLVGFNLSPLLWKKIRRGLSAGRVQSPALRMIVEREEAIEAFVAREYWTLDADVDKGGQGFSARLSRLDGEKLDQFAIADQAGADATTARLAAAADGALTVASIERKTRKRNPAAPFTTSTLQQEASRKLRFTTQRTMRTAQQLYEGVDTGDGESVGLITYMRTDSVNLAAEALEDLRTLIRARFGAEALPDAPRHFKTRSKNAQEAHEAIRPTAAEHTPESLQRHLSADQYKLYDLIWKRAVACQMQHATINTVAIDLTAGINDAFRATGSIIVDPGFMAVYREDVDDSKEDGEEGRLLPAVEEGERLELKALRPEQHFTEPPPRFSEASLVKTLEEFGIGRPSTYASIIKTLQDREYVRLEKRRFYPSDVGRVVSRMLTRHFSRYVDYDFTARLEDELDAVARGEEAWRPLLKSFWEPFRDLVAEKDRDLKRSDVTTEPLDETCPKCERPLVIRLGKRGRFVGCTGFNSDEPCDYTRDLGGDGDANAVEKIEGRSCPVEGCGGDLLVRSGRYGKFIGCSNYPNCRHMEPLERPRDTGVACPKCGEGSLMARKSRRGKPFFSCSTYPKCDYAVWNEPLAEPCPECAWPILTLKTTRTRGNSKVCPQRECSFSEALEDAATE